MEEPTGQWYSYGPGGPGEDLPEPVRQELLSRKAKRDERRGRLLARVDVYVWENGEANSQVSFPPKAALSVEDREGIAEVVRIARDALAGWR
jgi:hypothetical protein